MFSEFQQKVETLIRALRPLHFVGYAYSQSATIEVFVHTSSRKVQTYTLYKPFFRNWGYSKKDSNTIISKFGLFFINVRFILFL